MVLAVLLFALDAWASPFAYVWHNESTGSDASSISVIDTGSNAVVATIPMGNNTVIAGMVVHPAGSYVYVSKTQYRAGVAGNASASVSVIDARTNNVVATIPLDGNRRASGIAINPAGTYIYVAKFYSGPDVLSVIDTRTNKVVATIPVGQDPEGVVANSAGTRVYVVNGGDNDVSVIDTRANEVVATIPVQKGAGRVSINPSGTRVYVRSRGISPSNIADKSSVSVIDTSTNSVVAVIDFIGVVGELGVDPTGKGIYASNVNDNTISAIDTNTNKVAIAAPVHVGNSPSGVAVNPSGTYVYVSNWGDNTVSVINTRSNTVVTTIPVGNNPSGIIMGR